MYQDTKIFNIGTLNVKGCRDLEKRRTICQDAANYNIQILGITETHYQVNEENTLEEFTNIKGKDNKTRSYQIYHSGTKENTYAGVGLMIEKVENIKPRYKRISERIIKAGIQIDETHYLNIVVAYAPTLEKSEKDPKVREEFYDALEETIRPHIKDKHMLMIIGDLNAKTGTGHTQFKDEMGKYGKGKKNSNGDFLLQLARENKLILTNTIFPHKMAHRTTWTSEQRIKEHKHHDGTPRRNPYRNQIDYIITKQLHKNLIQNSRSYGGTETNTDHKLLITNVNLKWKKLKRHKTSTNKINISKLQNDDVKMQYKIILKEKITQELKEHETPQETWTRMTKTILETAKTTIGYKDKQHNHITSEEIKSLHQKQKKLKLDIESTISKEKKQKLKKERNQLLNKIKYTIKDHNNKQIEEEIKQIESYKDDSNRCHQAVRVLKSKKAKKPLIIKDKEGKLIGAEKEQVKMITNYFKDIFSSDEEIPEIKPVEMNPPFCKQEIQKATKSLKNNKSTGKDDINSELIKYAPEEVHEQIADMLNNISKTGEYPAEIKHGILTPLAKPPKKNVQINARPIVLLSVIRKILTITLIRRTWERMKSCIPKSQAAYQKGRSTTEQVFTLKVMIEKAITSSNYDIFITLLDMSKAFDTVSRAKLLDYLKEILTPCELHMMYILIHDVKLNVRLGKTTGDEMPTNIGITQGDCLSALLFIFYLAKTIKEKLPKHTIEEDNQYKIRWSALDWIIDKDIHKININPKYADDISFIRSDKSKINQAERIVPQMLKINNLQINNDKTEKYHINTERKDEIDWKKCKYLGSRLDTETDINIRKGILSTNYNTLEKCFTSKYPSEETKLRLFTTHIESVFLYNSEIWTLTKSLEQQIDSYHRRQLRKVIGIHWPEKICNRELYTRTQQTPWSMKIFKRRINWLGHLLRLHKDTPARKALIEAYKETKAPRGKPRTTWLQTIFNDLLNFSTIQINKNQTYKEIICILEPLANNRKEWNKMIHSMMLSRTTNMQ